MRILLLERVRQPENHEGQAGLVVRRRLLLQRRGKHGLFDALHCSLAVDATDTGKPPGPLERLAQQARVRQAVLHDVPVAVEAQVDQVVVLSDHRGPRPREVERVRLFRAAEIVQLEDQLLGQVRLIAPDDPSQSGIHEAVFVAGRVDGFDAGELEIPGNTINSV